MRNKTFEDEDHFRKSEEENLISFWPTRFTNSDERAYLQIESIYEISKRGVVTKQINYIGRQLRHTAYWS